MDQAELQGLLDRQAITEVLYRYCRAMDRADRELGYTLWHEDAEVQYGDAFRGSGREFVDFVCDWHLETCLAHSHQVSAITIALDGDRAASEAYVTATLQSRDGDQVVQRNAYGRYLDSWERRDGRWAIVNRQYVHDFEHNHPAVGGAMEGWSTRDRSDPSYAVLGQIGRPLA
jgi:hypothetical protein